MTFDSTRLNLSGFGIEVWGGMYITVLLFTKPLPFADSRMTQRT